MTYIVNSLNNVEIRETDSLIVEKIENTILIFNKKDYLKGKLHKVIRVIKREDEVKALGDK